MAEVCSICEGSGLRVVVEDGRQVARACECRVARRAVKMLERTHIPKRYEHCSLDNYESGYSGADRTLASAHFLSRRFVEEYPVKSAGTGLLFSGSIGVGKTHLAVGVLKQLIQEWGVQGLFCDYRELLKEVQNSYNQKVAATEMEVLRPIFNAEVLVLDELGAAKPSEWVWDTVAHILNSRYNNQLTTIITSNYANLGALGTEIIETLTEEEQPNTAAGRAAKAAMRQETLGDRIGERMRSRLQEMCLPVEVYGKDFRQGVKSAVHASGIKRAISTPALISTDGNRVTTDSSLVVNTRIGEALSKTPEQEQGNPVVGRARMGKWEAPYREPLKKNY